MNSEGAWIALASLTVTVLLAYGAGLWKLAALTTRFEVMIGEFQKDLIALQADRASVAKVPEHERRIGVLEKIGHALAKRVARLEGRSNPEILLEDE